MKRQDNTETERREQQGEVVPEYVRAKVGATLISVAVCTFWDYHARGLISSYKLSDKVTVFKVSELRAFVESKIVKAA